MRPRRKQPPGFFDTLPRWRAGVVFIAALPLCGVMVWLAVKPAADGGVARPWNYLLAAATFVVLFVAIRWAQNTPWR